MKAIEKQDAWKLLSPYLPADHSKQVTAEYYAHWVLEKDQSAGRILDLGCGAGDSIDLFRVIAPENEWYGVDIEDSPEVRKRRRTDGCFSSYDGINLPYPDAYFRLVYSRQVLEHVRNPDALLRNVSRVLQRGGYFAGSVAYLEPYHSYSIFNFTPYGLSKVCQDSGLDLIQMRPGIDGPTLITRQMLNKPKFFRWFETRSPFNLLVGGIGKVLRLDDRHRNFLKLQFCGHICFLARKTN